jgi:hypothetical protein
MIEQQESNEEKSNQSEKIIVNIGEGKLVESTTNTIEISSFIVDGSNVIAIDGIHEGKFFGAITNYDASDIKSNIKKINQFGEQIGNNIANKKINAELFVRGDWKEIENKIRFKPQNDHEVRKLTESIKENFGEKTSIKIVPYNEDILYSKDRILSSGNPWQGKISINVPTIFSSTEKRIVSIF